MAVVVSRLDSTYHSTLLSIRYHEDNSIDEDD